MVLFSVSGAALSPFPYPSLSVHRYQCRRCSGVGLMKQSKRAATSPPVLVRTSACEAGQGEENAQLGISKTPIDLCVWWRTKDPFRSRSFVHEGSCYRVALSSVPQERLCRGASFGMLATVCYSAITKYTKLDHPAYRRNAR